MRFPCPRACYATIRRKRVAGLFEVENGLIARWSDYWDAVTLQPILDQV
ncbi:MAG TPA: hypothetical protein EYQ81_06820 [Sneathiellales bacterium]|nr:hypothetical protein [Sneathiellales bacterium]